MTTQAMDIITKLMAKILVEVMEAVVVAAWTAPPHSRFLKLHMGVEESEVTAVVVADHLVICYIRHPGIPLLPPTPGVGAMVVMAATVLPAAFSFTVRREHGER